MRNCLLIISILLISIGLESCKDAGVQPVELQFSDVESMEYFYGVQPGTYVFRTPDEWNRFVEEKFTAVILGTIQLPQVDFSKEIVVGVFWGGVYSGCTNVSRSIEKVILLDNKVEVNVGPVQYLGLCRMIVAPRHIVKIPKSELPVVFMGNVPS